MEQPAVVVPPQPAGLFTPLLGIAFPATAARRLAEAGPARVWLTTGAVIVALVVALTIAIVVATSHTNGRTSLAEIWDEWHQGGPWLEILVAVLGGSLSLGMLLLALINLPFVHRSGSIWDSYTRSLASVAVCGGLAVVLIAVVGALAYERATAPYHPRSGPLVGSTILLCCVWTAYQLGRAAYGAQSSQAPEVPPRCESCGYDLTHVPAEGRCSECGTATAASLEPRISRPDASWARRQSLGTWVSTAARTLFAPRAFYRSLRLRPHAQPDGRRDDPLDIANRFGFVNFLLLLCGAATWFAVVVLIESHRNYTPPLDEVLFVMCVFSLCATLFAWACYRGMAALGMWQAIWRQEAPDFRWVAVCLAYESVYLWLPMVATGLLLGSFIIAGSWISEYVEQTSLGRALGAPVEVVVMLLTVLVFLAIWSARLRGLVRAVRWSNF